MTERQRLHRIATKNMWFAIFGCFFYFAVVQLGGSIIAALIPSLCSLGISAYVIVSVLLLARRED